MLRTPPLRLRGPPSSARSTIPRPRQQATAAPPPPPPPPPPPRAKKALRRILLPTLVIASPLLALYYLDSRSALHSHLLQPLVRLLPAEDAHRLAVQVLGSGLGPKDRVHDWEGLKTELWGKELDNPLGIAAGFDKHAEAIDGLFDLGFGYVEVGSVTPEAQPGNPLPRVFRLPEDGALINRYGFNSPGHLPVLERLRSRLRSFVLAHAPDALAYPLLSTGFLSASLSTEALGVPRSLRPGRVLALNLGKNRTSAPDDVEDYVLGVRRLGPFADVLVINVSSPNTPGLRGMQRRGVLEELLSRVVKERDALEGPRVPVLVKVAPDLAPDELTDVGEAAKNVGLDGVIISNTTIQRPPTLQGASALEIGGLSGRPILPLSLSALRTLYLSTEGSIPLIGCGGISSASDALAFAKAGASLVQLYTAFGYAGVGLPREIKDELAALLQREGKTWREVVGEDMHRAIKDKRRAAAVRDLVGEVDKLVLRVKKLEGPAGEEQVVLEEAKVPDLAPGVQAALPIPSPVGTTVPVAEAIGITTPSEPVQEEKKEEKGPVEKVREALPGERLV